jgi:hypothetical protein
MARVKRVLRNSNKPARSAVREAIAQLRLRNLENRGQLNTNSSISSLEEPSSVPPPVQNTSPASVSHSRTNTFAT